VVCQERPLHDRQDRLFLGNPTAVSADQDIGSRRTAHESEKYVEANDAARAKADVARHVMLAAIIAGGVAGHSVQFILRTDGFASIIRLIESANEIRGGIWILSWKMGQETRSVGFGIL
jgi:hypothetical protein